jgi:hypothetical protein
MDNQKPPAPQQNSPVEWIKQMPPWLPPMLWIAGGGTLGAGGIELAGSGSGSGKEQECVEVVEQLQRTVSTLAHGLSECSQKNDK